MRLGLLSTILTGLLLAAWSAEAASIEAVPIEGNPSDGIIVLKGQIDIQDAETFRTRASQFLHAVVVLRSPGGSAVAGIEIGKIIRLRNFSTWVPSGSVCESACAIAWLGGTPRTMGSKALIGFHAAYVIKDGKPQESGVGNALVGSYLGQIGIPDAAVMFFTNPAPDQPMAFLTPDQANALGLQVTLFDLPDTTTDVKSDPESLKEQALEFVSQMYLAVSGPNDKLLQWARQHYGDHVLYFGKNLTRDETIDVIRPFLERWPMRSYRPRADSIEVSCDNESRICAIQGIVDFLARSIERLEYSVGVATFDVRLSVPASGMIQIASEDGKTIQVRKRRLDGPDATLKSFQPGFSGPKRLTIAPTRVTH